MKTDPERVLDEDEERELRWRLIRLGREHNERAQKCLHKSKFASKTQAEATISHRLQGKVHAYHCDICRQWHIGGSEHVFRAKRAQKRILTQRREECE